MTHNINIKHILYLLLTIALLSLYGCRKSYPGMTYEEEKIQVDEHHEQIPIIVAVEDPLMITTSRGVGPLDDEEETYEKWLKTQFHVYAFLARNSKYNGPIDYRAVMNAKDEEDIFCLVSDTLPDGHGKRAHISPYEGMQVSWENDEEVLYYNLTYQDYRYNFFAYHVDDAAINQVKKERDHIELDLTIDGSQDLMLGVAAPTSKQIDALCKDSKWTAARIHDLAYSTATGHRDVVPVVAMRHMLSRFSFKLTGKHEDAANVVVRDIYVKSKNRALMTVAADDTTRLGLVFPDELNPERDEWPELHLPIEEDGVIHAGGFTKEYGIVLDSTYVIGEDLLLPPGETFKLVLDCKERSIKQKPNNVADTTYITYPAVYELKLTGDKQFEPGVKYIVNVNVYGRQKINIELDNIGWLESEDIELGEDDLRPF